jgi:hypothetical protein
MPADQDMSPEDRDYAAHLLTMARQELAEVQSADAPAVVAVVLHALVELFEDAANGYVTLAGLAVAIRQGLEDERLITPPQTALVGLESEQEQQRQTLYHRYLRLIEQREPGKGDGFVARNSSI